MTNAQEIPTPLPAKIGETTDISVRSPHPYQSSPDPETPVWTYTFYQEGATFVRVHIADETALDPFDSDVLEFRDADNRLIAEYRGAEAAGRWTPLAEGDTLTAILLSEDSPGGHGVVIDKVSFGTAPLFPTQVTAGTNYFDICGTSVPARIRVADPVARLVFEDECGGIFSCTGWLFSPVGHLMTNAHCVNSQVEADSLECWFNYMNTSCDLPGRPTPDRYSGVYNPTTDRGIKFVRMHCDLDYTVLIIDDLTKGNPADVYGSFNVSLGTPTNNTPIWIPQHPLGNRKQIAEDCVITDRIVSGFNGCSDPNNGCPGSGFFVGDHDMQYNCQTDNGSSGSPVLNNNNQVIAIAHAGSANDPLVNFGVRMAAIADDLPNVPVSLTVSGPTSVSEDGTAQFTAVVSYLLTADRNVTRSTEWSVASSSAGVIDDNGLFTPNDVTSDRTTTIGGSYTQSGVTVTGSARITILNVPVIPAIVSSDPPSGAIDARQPSDLADDIGLGWDSVDLFFDNDPSLVTVADFNVQQQGGLSDAPNVIAVQPLVETQVRVIFSRSLEPGTRTILTHVPSASQVTLGFLPSDVDADGTANDTDVSLLVEYLGTPGILESIPIWAVDLDRSGGFHPLDLMRALDLLNGADGFAPWNDVSLPP